MFGECHAHIFMNGTDYWQAVRTHREQPDQAVIRSYLERYQECGITYIRDGGDHYGASVYAREIAPEYGIVYRTPVFGIYKKGHYGKIVGRGFDNMREYRDLVDQAAAQKADFIKIMTTGLLDFEHQGKVTGTALEPAEVKEMIDIAHDKGMPVMSHTNGAAAAAAAIEAGVDSLEHGNYMEDETIHMLAESATVWVPTVVTVKNLIGDGRYEDEVLVPIWEKTAHNLQLAFRLRAHVALGSDAGAYRVLHGQGVIDEYEAYCQVLGKSPEVEEWLQDGEKRIREKF
ncbi:MAG: amidohydrolase family protein [Blautia sp.]|jgi:imidazolonepropionase-like amidohydrolase